MFRADTTLFQELKGVRSPWMNARLSEAMHKRDHYHRKALKSKSGNHWSRYKLGIRK